MGAHSMREDEAAPSWGRMLKDMPLSGQPQNLHMCERELKADVELLSQQLSKRDSSSARPLLDFAYGHRHKSELMVWGSARSHPSPSPLLLPPCPSWGKGLSY